jgi:hypothetical protein
MPIKIVSVGSAAGSPPPSAGVPLGSFVPPGAGSSLLPQPASAATEASITSDKIKDNIFFILRYPFPNYLHDLL